MIDSNAAIWKKKRPTGKKQTRNDIQALNGISVGQRENNRYVDTHCT